MGAKSIIVSLILGALVFHATSQTRDTLSMNCKDLPLEIILDSISYKTGYFFSYNADAIPEGSLYTLNKQNLQIDSLLSYLLVGTGLTFNVSEDQIILRPLKKIRVRLSSRNSLK